MKTCRFYDPFFETCGLYVTQKTNFGHDGNEYVSAKCKDILCEYKDYKNKGTYDTNKGL